MGLKAQPINQFHIFDDTLLGIFGFLSSSGFPGVTTLYNEIDLCNIFPGRSFVSLIYSDKKSHNNSRRHNARNAPPISSLVSKLKGGC